MGTRNTNFIEFGPFGRLSNDTVNLSLVLRKSIGQMRSHVRTKRTLSILPCLGSGRTCKPSYQTVRIWCRGRWVLKGHLGYLFARAIRSFRLSGLARKKVMLVEDKGRSTSAADAPCGCRRDNVTPSQVHMTTILSAWPSRFQQEFRSCLS